MRQISVEQTTTGGTIITIGGIAVTYPRGIDTWQAYRGQSIAGIVPYDAVWGHIGPRLMRRYIACMATAIRARLF